MKFLIAIAVLLLLQACKQPLEIVGQGDIVERLAGVRGCTYEDFQAQATRCAENDVSDSDYVVSYQAIPREGWVFKGWEGTACGADSVAPYCEYEVDSGTVDLTNGFWPGIAVPATVAVFQRADLVEFEQHIGEDVLQAKCLNCHFEGGVSGFTRLVFDRVPSDQQDANNYAVFEKFVDEVEGGGDLILTKIRGGAGHGGGSIFSLGSDEFVALAGFLDDLEEGAGSNSAADLSSFWEGVELESPRSTLRRAAIILGGELPTEADYQLAESSADGLRQALLALLQGDGFHEFLISGANDRLLTDALYNSLAFDVLDANADKFPVLASRQYNANIAGNQEAIDAYWNWQGKVAFGASRSPLELIAYVVENNRPYSEILTADYAMVNPQLSEVFRSDVLPDDEDPTVFVPATHKGQIFSDDQLMSEYFQDIGLRIDSHSGFLENYPHAGVLNTLAYLARYPSTETNRNRARARWTYLHFLGVDIEKSAARTIDPTALADNNNPTLNNPNCAVCHQLHDPVAGTFQNYGNEGWYRSSWGGQDSLPDTYKYPQWFDENAELSPYQEGDTWYRNMRKPGLSSQATNNPENSLQWLAQQITSDDRFAVASVKFWWPALMGSAPLEAPEASGDDASAQRLTAFDVQNGQIAKLAEVFRDGIEGGASYNLRDLLVEMMISPWFRAGTASEAALQGRDIELDNLGNGRLLTPREMNNKTRALLGRAWDEQTDVEWKLDGRYSQLMDTYRIYYGGIDSAGITDRARQLTSLMSNVAQIQALQMACPTVMMDFNRPENDKILFRGIDRNITPLTEIAETFDVSADDFRNPQVFELDATLEAGTKRLSLSFVNDYATDEEGDRNLIIDTIQVRGPQGLVLSNNAEDLPFVAGFTQTEYEWGGTSGDVYWDPNGQRNGWMHWSEGFISIPIELQSSGAYTVTVWAWGQQAGPESARMRVEIGGENPFSGTAGERILKEKLVELHARFLSEQHQVTDAEIDASYRLLVETWQARQERGVTWYPDWENEQCQLSTPEWEWLETIDQSGSDPSYMMGSWTSVLIYLMTDFRFLHE